MQRVNSSPCVPSGARAVRMSKPLISYSAGWTVPTEGTIHTTVSPGGSAPLRTCCSRSSGSGCSHTRRCMFALSHAATAGRNRSRDFGLDASAQRVLRVLRAAAVWSTIEHRPLAGLSAMALDVTTPQPKGTTNLRLGYSRRQTLVPAIDAATAACVGLPSDLFGDGCALGSPVRELRTSGSDRGVGR